MSNLREFFKENRKSVEINTGDNALSKYLCDILYIDRVVRRRGCRQSIIFCIHTQFFVVARSIEI